MSITESPVFTLEASRQDGLARRLAASARERTDADRFERWRAQLSVEYPMGVRRVPWRQLDHWTIAPGLGDIVHDSGRFFAVRGVNVQTNARTGGWSQPIIHQPESGILGLLATEFDGVLHFLVQAKTEPGNINGAQISPTVQATPSNYLRAHHGSAVPYLEYFVDPSRGRVLVDSLQSEQGSWFYGKRNRNMVVEVIGDFDASGDFAWLTLGQIDELMKRPNVINMDLRSVLSCLPFPSAGLDVHSHRLRDAIVQSADATNMDGKFSIEVRTWLADMQASRGVTARLVPLNSIVDWERNEEEIYHPTGRYFRVIGVEVEASNREVSTWSQPLLKPCGTGLVAFVARRVEGTLQLLARTDVRAGYQGMVEIGPTVQCTPQNFPVDAESRPEFLELALSDEVTVHYDVAQSEEGGRFYQAVTRHMIVEVDARRELPLTADYRWLTLAESSELIHHSCLVNIEARSLLSCLQTCF
jgi:NDP-hexose 2,3-dehydratase